MDERDADAEWLGFEGVNDHFTCSKCSVITKKAEEFCPHCGAKMKKEADRL